METLTFAKPKFLCSKPCFVVYCQACFCFCTLPRISDSREQTFGHPCCNVRGVPPQSNHPPNDVPLQVSNTIFKGWCSRFAPYSLARILRRSHLRSTSKIASQHQAVVNLRGVFSSRRDSPAYSPEGDFIRPLSGTVGISLLPWCKSALNRQGITLP